MNLNSALTKGAFYHLLIVSSKPYYSEGKGMQIVRDYALKSHFEAVPIIFKEKPTISLYQLLRISFIRGVDTQWDNICDCNSSIDELTHICYSLC